MDPHTRVGSLVAHVVAGAFVPENLFDGKVAIVTGAGGGLGEAACRILVERGAKVVMVDLKGATELAAELGPSTIGVQADVSKEADVQHFIGLAFDKFGALNFLFSNAGIMDAYESFIHTTQEAMLRTFNVNLMGSFLTLKTACNKLVERGDTCFSAVCTSSIAAIRADISPIQYSVAKGGLVSFVRSAQDFMLSDPRMRGFRVNAICPGGIVSSMVMGVQERLISRGEVVRGYRYEKNPPADPGEIVNIVLFLLSPESKHICGQAVVCDGGQSNAMGMFVGKRSSRK
eukprot:GEMP01052973.1.p1 GENE.GEMP01052973.1~~GEMP01052973.1.p1  ORF type:complete len:288 (+),score=63.04 GEMP01052973.1:34-897(+)